VGGRAPAYCTALGKAMLAFEDRQSQKSALASMPRRTEFTIIEPRAMEAALDGARQTGVAYDREEAYAGLGCIASPIRGTGRAIGAVSVTGPVARVQAQWLVHEVRSTALAIWSGQAVSRRAS
jgi:DNA-binding IclR family transcriptional regulator